MFICSACSPQKHLMFDHFRRCQRCGQNTLCAHDEMIEIATAARFSDSMQSLQFDAYRQLPPYGGNNMLPDIDFNNPHILPRG